MKKALSLALALAMCLSLTIPAFAADLTGPQLAPNTWGKGPSLTLKGVVGERAVGTDPRYIYDVEVGGSLELDMPYPAGKDRIYIFNSYGVYATPDYTKVSDSRWDLPGEFKNDMFDSSSGRTKLVYTFTEADMRQQNGFDKFFRIGIFWSDVGGGYTDDEDGSVCFGIHVVPASSAQPTTPAQPQQPAVTAGDIPVSGTAVASTQTVTVDGKKMEFQMYALIDANGNATNYIKLRDVAYVLNGTRAQFNVDYSSETGISVASGQAYQANGSEMKTPFSGNRSYTNGGQTEIYGCPMDLTSFTLLDDNGGGYSYFKLRDLGKALCFNVGWSAEKGIYVESDKTYIG